MKSKLTLALAASMLTPGARRKSAAPQQRSTPIS